MKESQLPEVPPGEDFSAEAAEVARRDPDLARVMAAVGPVQLRPPLDGYFAALVRSIAFQQLAGSAAAAIHARFLAAVASDLTPANVLATPEAKLRSAGLSGAKARSILDLAQKAHDGTVPLEDIEELGDDEIVERLIAVRGIGRWTAEMFLIFQLRRLDVWPVDDLAVRKGWAVAHRLPESPKPKSLMELGEPLRPYRTIAAWYCWRATDTVLPEG